MITNSQSPTVELLATLNSQLKKYIKQYNKLYLVDIDSEINDQLNGLFDVIEHLQILIETLEFSEMRTIPHTNLIEYYDQIHVTGVGDVTLVQDSYIELTLDKIYVVNLKDRLDRWSLFKNLNNIIIRHEAVDTRHDPYKYNEYGLKLQPTHKTVQWNFTYSKGAVGCYLSHYEIYNDIVSNKYKNVLILEDDADVDDVQKVLNNPIYAPAGTDLLQLNKRTQYPLISKQYEGTESYIITNHGAEKLIKATHDFSYFTRPPRLPHWYMKKRNSYGGVFKTDFDSYKQKMQLKNTIKAPIDEFIGMNAAPGVPAHKRLKINLAPAIRQHDSVSDVTDGVPHWDRTPEEIEQLEFTDEWKWWELDRVRDFNTPPDEDSIILLCTCRDEAHIINKFVDHYVKLGTTHFVFIDNMSEDDTLNILNSYQHLNFQIYQTKQSYADNNYGMSWINKLIRTWFNNNWCVVVDPDELIHLQPGFKTLYGLRYSMKKSKSNVAQMFLLDLYRYNNKIMYDTPHSSCIYSSSLQLQHIPCLKGGFRHRVSSKKVPDNNSSCITKKSFFHSSVYKTHQLSPGMHFFLPNDFDNWCIYSDWENQNQHIKYYPNMTILGHYKFAREDLQTMLNKHDQWSQDWDNNSEYKQYEQMEIVPHENLSHEFHVDNIKYIYKQLKQFLRNDI